MKPFKINDTCIESATLRRRPFHCSPSNKKQKQKNEKNRRQRNGTKNKSSINLIVRRASTLCSYVKGDKLMLNDSEVDI